MAVEFLEETSAAPSGGVEFLDEEPVEAPAVVAAPQSTPPISGSASGSDEFDGFEDLPPVERAKVMGQVEADFLEAEKARTPSPEQLSAFEPDETALDLEANYVRAKGRFEKLSPRYQALTPEGSRRLANQQAAAEDEKMKREFQASGKGPGFLDAGVAYLGSKLSHMGSGVMSSIEPSFPSIGEARQNLGEHGRQLAEFSSLNTGPAAAIARGGVDVGVMMTGNPAGFLRTIASIGMKSANEAYGATLAATGDRGAAADASAKTYRDTLLYAAVGASTAKAANAMVPSTVSGIRRGIIAGGAATGANVATSAGMAAAHGEDYGLQQFAADVLMGGVQGVHEARNYVPPARTDVPPEPSIKQPVPSDVVQPSSADVGPSADVKTPQIVATAIDTGDGNFVTGETWNAEHKTFTQKAIEQNPEIVDDLLNDSRRGFIVREPDGTERFVDRKEAYAIAGESGQRSVENSKGELNSQDLVALPPRKLGPGAANIEEFGPQRQIAAYNAKVDEQRATRGLPPLMSEARRPIAEIWDKAEQRMEADPTLPDRLVKEANEEGRKAFTDEEQAAVLWKMTDLAGKLETEHARLGDESLDAGARLEAESQAKFYEDQLADIETANRKAGTAWGRSGRTRQVIANADFTLASLIGKRRRVKGKPLTPEERVELQEQAKRYSEAEQKLRDIEEGETIKKLETEAAKDPAFTPEVRSLADRIVARLEEAAKGSSERIKALMSKLGSQLSAGADIGTGVLLVKELAVRAALEIGKAGIKTTVKFKRWAAKIVQEFGDAITPYVKKAWDEADASSDQAALGKNPRATKDENPEQIKAQKALDTAMVERERMDQMLAGEIAPAKRQPREALTQLEEDARAEIQAMRGLAAEVKSAERPKTDPNTVRENAQVVALERAAAEYERKLNEMDLGGTGKKQGPDTARVAKARALRDAARRAVEAARKLANPPRTKEQIALDNYKKMAARKTAEYEERTAKGEFGPRAKKPKLDISKDPEAIKAKAEMDRVRNEFERKQVEWERAQRSAGRKLWDGVKETLAASRSLITSADVSAPFRQGGFLLLGDLVFNPRRAARQLGTMFKQLVSERGFEEAQAEISLRPNSKNGLYDQMGLYLGDLSTKLSAREESMRSNLAERIPIIGRIVRASNRAYSGFLNRQRVDAADAMVESFGGADNITPEQAAALGSFINAATGRGTEGGLNRSADVMARYFFSPRFLASRFQLALGTPFTGSARRVVAQQYAKFGVGLAAVYGLALLAGSKVEKDPRSSDFGKARFGNTRIDPLAGLAQVTTFLARQATGETKQGSRVEDRNRWDELIRFGRTKLAPIPSVIADRMKGQRLDMTKPTPYRKAPLTALGEDTKRLVTPLGYGEAPGIYREHGAVRGTIMNALGLLGFGLQNYERKN